MGVRDVVRNGWHPGKDTGEKESWRKDFKGVNQVAGWIGKGSSDKDHASSAHSHVSRPLATLQDPSSFGAPPKHKDYYGEEAAKTSSPATIAPSNSDNAIPAPHRIQTNTQYSRQKPGPAVPPRAAEDTETQGKSHEDINTGPFRVDTTGLSTSGLPPPPVHRNRRIVETDQKPSSLRTTPVIESNSSTAYKSPNKPNPPSLPSRDAVARPPALKTKPSLPLKPTLPPRDAVAGGKPEGHGDRTPPPAYSERDPTGRSSSPNINELQTRFARIREREAQRALTNNDEESQQQGLNETMSSPPPLPLSTKPRG